VVALDWIATVLPALWLQASQPAVWSVSCVILLAGKLSGVADWIPWWSIATLFFFPAILSAAVVTLCAVGPVLLAILTVVLEARAKRAIEERKRAEREAAAGTSE
jgi:hypothetical protein